MVNVRKWGSDDRAGTEINLKAFQMAATVRKSILLCTCIDPPPSFHELVYQSSLDKLKNRMTDERCRSILGSVMPQYS